jgi:hypothetical protein
MIAVGLLFVRMLCHCFKSRRRLEAEILSPMMRCVSGSNCSPSRCDEIGMAPLGAIPAVCSLFTERARKLCVRIPISPASQQKRSKFTEAQIAFILRHDWKKVSSVVQEWGAVHRWVGNCLARPGLGGRSTEAAYFAGLGFDLRGGLSRQSVPQLRSRGLPLASMSWPFPAKLGGVVPIWSRRPNESKHSCAHSRNSLGDDGMARSSSLLKKLARAKGW